VRAPLHALGGNKVAKPELVSHLKFGRLARALGSRFAAMGVLELLWHHCYDLASDEVGTAEDIAWLVDWPPIDAARLAVALVDAGFLDDADGTYRVHDLWAHAPQYARRRRLAKKATSVVSTTVPVPSTERTAAVAALPCAQAVDTVENQEPNVRVLLRLCHELREQAIDSITDFKDALMTCAIAHHVPFDAESIRKTLALHEFSRRPVFIRRVFPQCRTGG
jgi:hypothetical protein